MNDINPEPTPEEQAQDAGLITEAQTQDAGQAPRRKLSKLQRNRIILGAVILVLTACFVCVGLLAYYTVFDPAAQFETLPPAAGPSAPSVITYYDETGTAHEAAVQSEKTDPWEELQKVADTSQMHDVVNILLIGVDYADERVDNDKAYVGKNFNSDVMMLLAIDFDEGTMDMISVPRDTYAQIPNAPDWPYKLNFSLTLGGGVCDAGFKNTCDSVSWVLGGIPINYYVAVTMPMLKEVVDIVGGVDFDIDVAFTIQDRRYEVGPAHLDGQGFLDYCRTRKNMKKSGDINRIDRQKEAMLTLFKKIKQEMRAEDIEPLLNAFRENSYTNMTFSQLAAVAVFGYDTMDLENGVNMRSFPGTYDMLFNFRYYCLNQKERVALIEDVYNVTVPEYPEYDLDYARWRWACMQIDTVYKKYERYTGFEYGSQYAELDSSGYYYVDDGTTDSEGEVNEYMGYSVDVLIPVSRGLKKKGYKKDRGETLLKMVEAAEASAAAYSPDFRWYCDVYKDAPVPMKE